MGVHLVEKTRLLFDEEKMCIFSRYFCNNIKVEVYGADGLKAPRDGGFYSYPMINILVTVRSPV